MQTFLPYSSLHDSVACLDSKRLGKQRVEAMQILNALQRTSGGWINHPAVRMWRGYEPCLQLYLGYCIDEWVRRGYRNTMTKPLLHGSVQMPPWLGDEALHASHRSNLLRKLPSHYGQFGWKEPPTLPYVWPTPSLTVPAVTSGMV